MTKPITRIKRHGQTYMLVHAEPYRRVNGKLSVLKTWESRCATCGAPFIITTGKKLPTWINRRCPRHRRPGYRVVWERRAQAQAERARERAADRAWAQALALAELQAQAERAEAEQMIGE